MISVKVGEKEVQVRPVNLGDYDAVRDKIRQERIAAVPNMGGRDALAAVISAPILNAEVTDWMDSRPGLAFLFSRCCNNKIPMEQIGEMVMGDDPKLIEWLGLSYAKNESKKQDD